MGYNTGQDESVLQRFLKFPHNVGSSSIFHKMAANALYGKSESPRIIWQRDLDTEVDQGARENIVHNVSWPIRHG